MDASPDQIHDETMYSNVTYSRHRKHSVLVSCDIVSELRVPSQKVAVHGPIPEIEDIFLELFRDLKSLRIFVVRARLLLRKWPIKMKMITIER